jgi:molybdenum cofactor synthesis domain-containing protein
LKGYGGAYTGFTGRDGSSAFFRAGFCVMTPIRAAILTVSDRGFKGERADLSGPALAQWLAERSVEVVSSKLVPDATEGISAQLKEWADSGCCDLILTTGGTGVSPRDRTPEATRRILDLEIPGIGEAMRAASFGKTPFAVLSRAAAGARGRTLIVNLPGSPQGAVENLAVVWPAIPHAVKKLQGDASDCVPAIAKPETP